MGAERARGRGGPLAATYPGRFILGLGVSHAPLVESTGQDYVKPYTKMVQFLDELPPTTAPVMLAALGPKMLELSRDRTLGAHPYFVPPEHTAFARSVLGPEPLLIPELAVALAPGAAGAAAARDYAQRYLRLPNYANDLKRFGFCRRYRRWGSGRGCQGSYRTDLRRLSPGCVSTWRRGRAMCLCDRSPRTESSTAGLRGLEDLVADLKRS